MSLDLEHVINKIEGFKIFAEKFRFQLVNESGEDIPLGNHQLLPIYDSVENGLRRFFLAYGTGAGKTNVPLQVIKRLKGKGQRIKVLVVAPYQTMLENWDGRLLSKNGLSMNIHRMETLEKRSIPKEADFVVVNYDKLVEDGNYHKRLMAYARTCDLVIVDEAHNVRNKNGERSRGLQKIIEASKGTPENLGRLIALSASPCPNEPKDLGMVLYMLDPFRYREYSEQPFVYQADAPAIWEMREKGLIRFFSKEDVKKFYRLPDFNENPPQDVTFLPEYRKEYFAHFVKCFKTGEVLTALERTSIRAMLASPEFKAWCRNKLESGTMLNFFSHLRNDEEGNMGDRAIFTELERVVRNEAKKIRKDIVVRTIHGGISDKERTAIQEECRAGKIDVLINQWKCTSEGYSEVAGDKPVAICPLRSPFDPGTQLQIIGRSWRPGQYAPVEYQEFHPESEELKNQIEKFVREYAESIGGFVRPSWFPTLFHRDCYSIRKTKENRIEIVLHQRPGLTDKTSSKTRRESNEDARFGISSMEQYIKQLHSKRIVDTTENDEFFGKGPRRAMASVGKSFDDGLKNDIEPLARDYFRDNIILSTPGRANDFIAQYVTKIKGSSKKSWRIIDLGCNSSAPFSQMRMIRQLENGDKNLDNIINLDGAEGCVRSAKSYLHKKAWCSFVTPENIPSLTKETADRVREQLNKASLDNLEFKVANFVTEDYGKVYDAVITSQSLQYNDQQNNRDIERALIRINHALPKGKHYLAVLTANHCKTSCTTPKDFENFLKLLPEYGFKIVIADMPEGRIGDKCMQSPFYFVHAIKEKEYRGDELVRKEKPLPMYCKEFFVLSGGAVQERVEVNGRAKQVKLSPLPTHYHGLEGKQLI